MSERPKVGAAALVARDGKILVSQTMSLTVMMWVNITLHFGTLGIPSNEDVPENLEPEKCQGMGWFGAGDLPRPLFKSWERVLGGEIESKIRNFLKETA